MPKMNCPGSSELTTDGKACEVKLDFPLFCGLTKDAVPGWPRCYSGDGKPIVVPPKPSHTAAGSSSTGTGKAKLQPACSDILHVQYTDLLDSINNIHAFESKLFGDLESVENGGESSMTSIEIKGRISDLSKLRNQLYTDLNNILTSTQCNLADGRQNLADQITMVDIVKKELDNAEAAIKDLEIIKNNRRRMVQITNYEKQRYGSHKDIFRTIAFCGLGVLIGVYLVNGGWSTIGKLTIVASIAVGVLLTMSSIYYNWWRSGMNWNRFDFGNTAATGGAAGETVYQHDVVAFDKLYAGTKSELNTLETKAEDEADKIDADAHKVYNAAVKDAHSAENSINSTTHKGKPGLKGASKIH
jgi:hypothetical protein